MSYLVSLDKFYGPLDLLLYLLERAEIDIYDIPIARITDQYMAYIEATGYVDLDNIGDFLSMASYLLKLKSKMLLPVYLDQEEMDGTVDPREELVSRILAYKYFKQAGECLGERYSDDSKRLFFRYGQIEPLEAGMSTSVRALLRAWDVLMSKGQEEMEYDLPQGLVVAEKMEQILTILGTHGQPVKFRDIFTPTIQRREALVYFLALLELIRAQRIEAFQQDQFGDITLTMRMAVDKC